MKEERKEHEGKTNEFNANAPDCTINVHSLGRGAGGV